MAIDRTAYAALVDDDGSNTTGSVIDKQDWADIVLDPLDNRPRCSAYHSTTQSVNNDTQTALTFDSEDFDSESMHDLVTNNSRITIPANRGGVYLLIGQVAFTADVDGYRQIVLRKNGTTELGYAQDAPGNATASPVMRVTTIAVLAAGDYIELMARHTAGAALNLGSATAAAANRLQVIQLI